LGGCGSYRGRVFRDIIVQFGMGLSEGFVWNGGEEFFKGHASKFDSGVGQRSVGIVVGISFGFGQGLLSFAGFEELFGDAEFGDFGAGFLAHETAILLELVKFFVSHTATAIGEEFFGDVRTCGPFPEVLFFFVSGVGLGESEPVVLDLEVIVGEGGAFEAGDVVGEMAQGGPFAVGVGFGVDVAGHGEVLELGPEEEFSGEA
jgi:hypothetical protein